MSPPRKHPPLPDELLEFARELRRGSTDAERRVWYMVRNRRFLGLKFRRQHPCGRYVLDFFCAELNLVVELDGGQHNSDEGRRHDERRTSFLESRGIRVLRFWNHHVLAETEAVMEAIYHCVLELKGDRSAVLPHPGPLPGGEGGRGDDAIFAD